MKKLTTFEICVNAVVFATFGLMALTVVMSSLWAISLNTQLRQLNAAWQTAAYPVFAARRMPALASRATPFDLKDALDTHYAMTYSERYKLSSEWRGHNLPTRIIIVPDDGGYWVPGTGIQ